MIADHQIKKDKDEIMKQYMEKFTKAHTAKIVAKYENTYVSFEKIDIITEKYIAKLKQLFDLMDINYSVRMSHFSQLEDSEEDEYCFIIYDEDSNRMEFIKKFINNGYKLTY